MAYYKNPYFNHEYVPATYSSLSSIVALSGWNPLESQDFTAYLCQILKNANLPNVDPVITIENENGFDYEGYLNGFYAQLSAIGDDRVNFYQVWNEISTTIVPRAIAQIEIAQEGGCQLIDGYICNADGTKIKKASNICQPVKDYKVPITYNEIVTKVTDYMKMKYDEHSDAFATYIKNNFIDNGWNVFLIFYPKMYIFYVEAKKDTSREYIKYYQESRARVSEKLNIPITEKTGYFLENDSPENFRKMIENFVVPSIPDYRTLI